MEKQLFKKIVDRANFDRQSGLAFTAQTDDPKSPLHIRNFQISNASFLSPKANSVPTTPSSGAEMSPFNQAKLDSPFIQKIPESDILKDCVCFVDVWSRQGNDNRSSVFGRILKRMGATIARRFTKNEAITHVVFKDGHKLYLQKAKRRGIQVVSCLWVERCRVTQMRANENEFIFDESNYKPPKRFKELQPLSPEEERIRSEERRKRILRKEEKEARFVNFLSPLASLTNSNGKFKKKKDTLACDTPFHPPEPYRFIHPCLVAETPNESIQRKLQRMKEGKPIFSPPSSPCSSISSPPPSITKLNFDDEDGEDDTPALHTSRRSLYSDTSSVSHTNNTTSPNFRLHISDSTDCSDIAANTIVSSQKSSDMELTCIDKISGICPMFDINENKSTNTDNVALEKEKSSSFRNTSHDVSSTNTPTLNLQVSSTTTNNSLNSNSNQSSHTSSIRLMVEDSNTDQFLDAEPPQHLLLPMEPESRNVIFSSQETNISRTSIHSKPRKKHRRILCEEEVIQPTSLLVSPQTIKSKPTVRRRSSRRSSVSASVAISKTFRATRIKSCATVKEIDAQSTSSNSADTSLLPPLGQPSMMLPATRGRFFSTPTQSASSSLSSDETTSDSRSKRRNSLSSSYEVEINKQKENSGMERRSEPPATIESDDVTDMEVENEPKLHQRLQKRRRESTSSSSSNEAMIRIVPTTTINSSNTRRGKKKEKFISDLLELTKSRRSTDEFVQIIRDPTQKSIVRKPKKRRMVLVLTSLHTDERQSMQNNIKKLGQFSVHSSVKDERASHVVCGAARRTMNVLRAISRGLWLLTKEWVVDSLEAGAWLDEENYEAINYFPVCRQARLLRNKSIKTAASWTLSVFKELKGLVYVAPTTTPPPDELRELVTLCGGHVINSPRRASVRVGKSPLSPALPAVSESWVLDSISENCLKPTQSYLIT
uniref:microcephalin isoform X2 n=1 Tax=Ciona intestinalis TaxID=7719 RepID=UPI000EF519D4|nr:microcephalin isoform X2 [Ciona intestinalis]|eukprot:XP_026689916.1 microcephalin isoform X2 [Ciona intestinalis]